LGRSWLLSSSLNLQRKGPQLAVPRSPCRHGLATATSAVVKTAARDERPYVLRLNGAGKGRLGNRGLNLGERGLFVFANQRAADA
jgi:hypothetical protein